MVLPASPAWPNLNLKTAGCLGLCFPAPAMVDTTGSPPEIRSRAAPRRSALVSTSKVTAVTSPRRFQPTRTGKFIAGDASIVPTHAPGWLVELARKKPVPTISERALATIRPLNGEPNAYGLAALDDEIASLAAAPAGTRNHTLNRAVFSLFQLVAGAEL